MWGRPPTRTDGLPSIETVTGMHKIIIPFLARLFREYESCGTHLGVGFTLWSEIGHGRVVGDLKQGTPGSDPQLWHDRHGGVLLGKAHFLA